MWKPYYLETPIEIDSFFSAFIRSCPKEYFFQGESHDFWEMAYVIKGSVCMTAEDKVIELYENQLIFHKPMEFHSMRTNSTKTTELFIMSFNAKGDYISRFENSIFSLNHDAKHRIFKIIEKIKEVLKNPNDIFEPTSALECLCKNELQFRLVANLTENFLISLSTVGANGTEFIKNTETMIYANALKIIDDNIYSKLTVSELAVKCNSSVSYLKKIFGKYNGLGIHEYILKNKISLAKQMLRDGFSVTEISDKLSFSSQNYFSTAFKREVGISPGSYKTDMY